MMFMLISETKFNDRVLNKLEISCPFMNTNAYLKSGLEQLKSYIETSKCEDKSMEGSFNTIYFEYKHAVQELIVSTYTNCSEIVSYTSIGLNEMNNRDDVIKFLDIIIKYN